MSQIPSPADFPKGGAWDDTKGVGYILQGNEWIPWKSSAVPKMPALDAPTKRTIPAPDDFPTGGAWDDSKGVGYTLAGKEWKPWVSTQPKPSISEITGQPIDSGKNRIADALSGATGMIKGQVVPPFGTPEYAAGAAVNLGKKAWQGIKGIPQMATGISDLARKGLEGVSNLATSENPLGGKAIDLIPAAGKMVGGMAKNTLDEMKEFSRDPSRYAYENPDKVANALLSVTGGTLAVKGLMSKLGLSATKSMSGASYKALVSKLDDAVLNAAGKTELYGIIPDDAVINVGKKFVRMPEQKQLSTIAGDVMGVRRADKLGDLARKANDTRGVTNELVTPKKPGPLKVLSDTIHSPEVVFDRNPVGQAIYSITDDADRNGKLFIAKMKLAAKKASGGIKGGDPIDTGVFKMRENQLTLKEVQSLLPSKSAELGFTPEEILALKLNPEKATKWNQFLTNQYDYSIRNWGKERVGAEVETDLWNRARAAKGNKDLTDGLEVYKKSLPDIQQEVLDQYSHMIPSYTPHVFDKSALKEILIDNLRDVNVRLRAAKPDSKEFITISKERDMINGSIEKLASGRPVLREDVPKSVKFGFFEKRRGMPGYQESSVGAFDKYIHGIARKTYDEPAIQRSLDLYDKLPDDLKAYAKGYLRHYGGYDRHPNDSIADAIKAFEWSRTLGLNPKSAITNLTQRVNKYADVPIAKGMKGQYFAWTPEARSLFDKSGLESLVTEQMMEGSTALGKIRDKVGFMFQTVERGNLRDSFSTGYQMAIDSGKTAEEAMKAGIKLAQKHHFRYGRVGTSQLMRGWGGVAFQFAGSYPVKQFEFLSKIAKENPAKIVKWIALSEGAKGTVGDVLGIDLSNALGMPIDVGEFVGSLAAVGEGDIRRAMYHADKTITGGGFAPQGPGPAMQLLINGYTALKSRGISGGVSAVANEVKPIMYNRVAQAIDAFKNKTGENLPIHSQTTGDKMYDTTPGGLAKRTVLGASPEERKATERVYESKKLNSMGTDILREIHDRLAEGNADGAIRLMERYKLKYTKAGVEAAIKRMQLSREERLKVPASRQAFEDYMRRGK
jgi:hypothetical protein